MRGRDRDGRREGAVAHAAVVLGIGQSYGLRIVVLGVVCLLLLLPPLVAITTPISARGRRHWALRQLRGAVGTYEQLVILAGGDAVAPVELLDMPVASGRSIGGIAIILAWRAAVVGVLILALGAHIGVRDVWVVVVLAVSVVRHDGGKARRGLGRRGGCRCGRKRHSRGYLTELRGHHDRGR